MSILLAYGCDDDSSSGTRGSTGGVMYRNMAGVPTTPMNPTNVGGSQTITPVTAGMMPTPHGRRVHGWHDIGGYSRTPNGRNARVGAALPSLQE